MLHDALFLSLSDIFSSSWKSALCVFPRESADSSSGRRDNRIILTIQIVPQSFVEIMVTSQGQVDRDRPPKAIHFH